MSIVAFMRPIFFLLVELLTKRIDSSMNYSLSYFLHSVNSESPYTCLILVHPWGKHCTSAWWRHQMETFSALLALYAGNSPVPGEFPAQRPVTRSFDVFFDQHPNIRLSKQSLGWWFETTSSPLWRHCNGKQPEVYGQMDYIEQQNW